MSLSFSLLVSRFCFVVTLLERQHLAIKQRTICADPESERVEGALKQARDSGDVLHGAFNGATRIASVAGSCLYAHQAWALCMGGFPGVH